MNYMFNTFPLFVIRTYRGHEGTVFGLDFTPDSQYIVSGSSDGDLQVWDGKFGHGVSLYLNLEGHDLGVMCCEFSPTFGVTGTSSFKLATVICKKLKLPTHVDLKETLFVFSCQKSYIYRLTENLL